MVEIRLFGTASQRRIEELKQLSAEKWGEMILRYFKDEGKELYGLAGFKGKELKTRSEDFANRAIEYCAKETAALLDAMSAEELEMARRHPEALNESIGIYIDNFMVLEGEKLLNQKRQERLKVFKSMLPKTRDSSSPAYIG